MTDTGELEMQSRRGRSSDTSGYKYTFERKSEISNCDMCPMFLHISTYNTFKCRLSGEKYCYTSMSYESMYKTLYSRCNLTLENKEKINV